MMNELLGIIKRQQEIINSLITMLGGDTSTIELLEATSSSSQPQIVQASTKSYEYNNSEFKKHLKEKGRSKNTIDTYCRTVELFYRQFKELNEDSLQAWEDYMYQSFKPKTINLKIAAMIEYLDFVGYPKRGFRRVKEQKKTYCDNIINEEQYNQFLDWTFKNKKITTWKAILTMANTGVRISELVSLKSENLKNGKGYVDIVSKANKQRRIYFPKSYIDTILPYCDKEYIITNKITGKEMTTRGVDELLRKHGQAAGLPKEVCHAHAFRHFFAKQFLKHNSDITLLGDLLGHSNVATTSIYTRMSTEEQQEKINSVVNW